MTEQEGETLAENYPLPSNATLKNIAKLSIVEDKKVQFDYWVGSCDGSVIIGVRDNEEKLLVKSEDEYTSPISRIFQVEDDYIIITENSIYVVSSKVSKKRITDA